MTKVLFVDDEALLALGAEMSLRDQGYDVEIAFDGEEALRKALVFTPDIVVTDFMMPKLDGAGLARALLGNRIKAPIVLVTAVPEADLSQETRTLFAAFLQKPLGDDELISCVATLFGR